MIGSIIAKKEARASYDVVNEGDINAMLEGWADDAVFHYAGDAAASGEIRGKEAIEAHFSKFFEQFPKRKYTVKNVFMQRLFSFSGTNEIAVEWDLELSDKAGNHYANSGCSVIIVRKEKVVELRDYFKQTTGIGEAWGEGETSE